MGTLIDRNTINFFYACSALAQTRERAELYRSAVFASGQFLNGEQVPAFEQKFAAAAGGHAIACGSGTAALEMCLRAAGIAVGDEVIIPANTSLFTAQAVLAAGASLRFADVEEDTLQLSAATVEAAWTSRTKAVIAVHLYGNACPVNELSVLCEQRGAVLVQDACQAHGLRIGERALSEYSPFVAYSFYPTKNLGGIGDGGAVVTSSPQVADHVRLLRDGGRSGDQLARIPAINSRLAELHAAYLRAALPHLERWNEVRRSAAAIYEQGLRGVDEVRLAATSESVRHQFVLRTARREALREHLRELGIETGVHYPHPLQRHPAFCERSSWEGDLPVASRACDEVLSLPIGLHVDSAAAERVTESVRSFFQ